MGRRSNARERIIRAAARLFLTRSYHAVGIEEVCAAAEVRKGSFYYYFASKSELAKAVIDLHAEAFWERLGGDGHLRADQRLHAAADAIGAIHADFEQRFGRVVGCPFGNLAAELATTDEGVRQHLAAVLAEVERRLAAVCHEAAEQALLRPGVDPDRLARSVLAQYQGRILLAKVNASSAGDLPAALHELVAEKLAGRAG